MFYSGKNVQLLLNILLIFVLISPCYAFEPKKHGLFSNHAASLYETCTGRALPEKWISAFAKGAVDEDEWGLTRATNWHFYNNGGKIGDYWKFGLHCHGSNESIYHKRLKTLDDMATGKAPAAEIYAIAGRVVHHIQDMSSPPHVMPIYHTGGDTFDKYPFAPVPLPKICKDVTGTVIGPLELLKQAAQNTLKTVANPVVFADGKTVENETWLKFWGGPDDKDLSGFKTYGDYGNHFGAIPPCKSDICRAYDRNTYDRNTFDRFYRECYTRAVADTVRLLIYLDHQYPGLK